MSTQPLSNQEEKGEGICRIHNQKIKILCLKDKLKICHDCALFGNHKGHNVKPINEILEENKGKKEKLEVALETLDTCHQSLESSLEKRRSALMKVVQNKFEELRKSIDYKESELFGKIDAFFNVQKARSTQFLGIDSKLRSNLVRKIKERENLLETDNFFSIMEEDISQFLSQMNIETIRNNNSLLLKNIQDIAEPLERSLSEQSQRLLKIDFSSRDLFEEIYFKFVGSFGENPNILNIETRLNIKIDKEIMRISTSNNKPNKTLFNNKDFGSIKKLQLTIGNYDCLEQDLKLIHHITSKLNKLTKLSVKFLPEEGLNDDRLLRLLPIIFGKSRTIQEINLSLKDCKVGDYSLVFLFEKILCQISSLKSLILTLNSTGITDQSLKALGKALPLLKDLQTFKIALYNTKISDEGVSAISVKMKAIQTLSISLEKTDVTNKGVESFVNNVLKGTSYLEGLELYLNETKVTDDGFIQVLENLKDTKRFGLGMDNTKATDSSINVLIHKTLPRLKSLNQLCIYSQTAELSGFNIERLQELMKKFKWLIK